MAVDDGFRAYVEELFLPVGQVEIKRMMGGLMMWEAGAPFALVTSESRIYLKADELTLPLFEAEGCEQFKNMPYREIPAEALEDTDLFREWVDRAIETGHRTAG